MINTEEMAAEGTYNPDTGECEISLSEIKSEILRSLRYCDRFLSDVLYGIGHLDGLVRRGEGGVVWLGFRKDGVDNRAHIANALMDERTRYHYYRDLIRVCVRVWRADRRIRVSLWHTNHNRFLKENGREYPYEGQQD